MQVKIHTLGHISSHTFLQGDDVSLSDVWLCMYTCLLMGVVLSDASYFTSSYEKLMIINFDSLHLEQLTNLL